MPRLKYADYYEEQMDLRGWGISQVHEKIVAAFPEFAEEFTVAACAEFARGRHTPYSPMASAWEHVFGVNLPPRYYARGNGRKP